MTAANPYAGIADGRARYLLAFMEAVRPDPELWIDHWADTYMRIPVGGGAEPGKYRTDRTPYAREVMRCLSPQHPAKRVVAQVASQLMKTQVALNWLCASIHSAPQNMLILLPTDKLSKRVSSRFSKTIASLPDLRHLVAEPRSRDARNTIDTKEFLGGTAYITTAGSAANLAEVYVRYLYGDEIDRWDVNVDHEGDPITLAETRGTTFGNLFKIYYTSTPTIYQASRIHELFLQSDQRYYYVPCPHCGHMQTLEWPNLNWNADFSAAWLSCVACHDDIHEQHKPTMLANGTWRAHAAGDGETVGFHLSALYMPMGWVTWTGLAKQYTNAKHAQDRGDTELMQSFYNTRLALPWDDAQERTAPEELAARAEDYRLRTVPRGALVFTAAVDVQSNRLELTIVGWGEGLERWVVDHQVMVGDPSEDRTWQLLDEYWDRPIHFTSGQRAYIGAILIDSGGHHTQEVYAYARRNRHRRVLAVKGASKPGRPIISTKPSKVDINYRGRVERHGSLLWMIGTDTAKDWLHNRLKLPSGPGAIHFSRDLPAEYYQQLTAERRLTRWVKGYKRTEWIKAKAERNEALDLLVYNLAAAHHLGLHKYQEHDWERLRIALDPPQKDMFDAAAPAPAPADTPDPAAHPDPRIAPRRRNFVSGWRP